ncbi:MAG: LysM peptidoglycan-binding domain-containing protein [Firmicutes bacterium]|nr:LysM peptidoglycan-binding domain-containing protein [Bacillota bacterium]
MLTFTLLPTENAEAASTYTVQPGDSLYLIGKQYGVTASQLKQTNGLSGNTIYVGQRLTIPGGNSGVHTVSKGETLFLIGKNYGVSYLEIMRTNNLNTAEIYPGQKLRIPAVSTTSRSSLNRISASDMDLLARLVSSEAQGESYKTQVAVGAVVLNRVDHNDFPSTIPGVVYDKSYGYYQFTPVLNGFINNPATNSSKKAAQDAVNGWDPTNGAIYFFESDVTNTWLQSKPLAARIGAFTFTY